MIMGNRQHMTNFWNCKRYSLRYTIANIHDLCTCVPVKFTTVLIRFPMMWRHMIACTLKLHSVIESDVENPKQLTVVLFVESGQAPQFL